MSINHSSSTVISGLVFSMDTVNKKSYVGPPIKNNPTGISFSGVSTSTGYVCTGITEVIDIPQLGPTTAYTSNIQNNYPTSGNCCPSLFQYGGYAVTGSTLYTYGIVYRCQSGYTHPNFMYRYEYNGGTYVTESGVHDNAKRIHLGNGWYWAWNTFTTQPSTTQINSSGLWFYNYSTFSDKISVAKVFVTQGDYTGLHPKYWPAFNTTISNTQAIVDLTNNNTITATSLTYASDGTFSFNGSSNFLSVPNSTSLQVADIFTISVWVYTTSLSNRFGIFSTRTLNATGCWQLEVGTGSGGQGRIAVTGIGTWIWESSDNVVATNTWYNICFVKSGNGTQGGSLYLNGTLLTPATTTAYTILNNSDAKVIGQGTSGGQFFPGRTGTVSLYNRALSAAEIVQNYNALKSRYNSPLTLQNQINVTSMTHSIVNPGGTGLQGAGSTVITSLGVAALSAAPGTYTYSATYFSTHGGHTGANSFPMYWGVYLGTLRAVNQVIVYVHPNSWGYFELAGSNDCGTGASFATNGTWIAIPFVSSNNGSNNQNMGGQASGLTDGTSRTFNYSNNSGYLAYRIKIIDGSQPTEVVGTRYPGSAGYSWQLNRV